MYLITVCRFVYWVYEYTICMYIWATYCLCCSQSLFCWSRVLDPMEKELKPGVLLVTPELKTLNVNYIISINIVQQVKELQLPCLAATGHDLVRDVVTLE